MNSLEYLKQLAIYLKKFVKGEILIDNRKITDLLNRIRNHLKSLNLLDEKQIKNVIKKIRQRDKEFVRKIKGELADIVDEQDRVIGITDIGICHDQVLRHRTANAFVVTPDGKILLQRRAPGGRKYELFLSIFGGHLKASETYEEALRDELQQELHLSHPPRGILRSLGKEQYQVEGDYNVEIRELYAYFLTPEEYAQVKKRIDEIEDKKEEKALIEAFTKWIIDEQKKKSGFGEVWGYHEIDLGEITGAKTEMTWVKDDKRDMELGLF
jgi:isopentenyldiphosphate isomerase